ncbi:MAG: hypothetical protein KGJ08_09700 [Gammaproteobacteria bacterium]|nr:hypothetical protein [Gammaproteobacteria bacterium]
MDYSVLKQEWLNILTLLRWANLYGIWGIAQFVILISSFYIGLKLIYFPRRRIRNLNFHALIVRNDRQRDRLSVNLELRNYTGRSVVLSSPFFRYLDLRPPHSAQGDTPSGEYEVKFPGNNGKELIETEYLLRNKESVHTVIQLDPAHTDDDAQRAHKRRRIGTLTVMCTWLQDRPRVQKLARRI